MGTRETRAPAEIAFNNLKIVVQKPYGFETIAIKNQFFKSPETQLRDRKATFWFK
ncbi:hypothetical protein SAMN05421813_13517 [Daejeonella rubra]|uniref:Uncharacterized protein n=1 Tax=Daejeonella rubra TaxID=990371 RepID=A0A1G9Y3J8_9SPHI|nr:hypothetical protein SAMN05421813_13517 [Daejeonella rubra]